MKRFGCMLVAAMSCAVLPAKTTVWQGGAGAKWSVAGNWSEGVPAAGDSVVLSGSSVNDVAGLVLASVRFSGTGVYVGGEALTLSSGGESFVFDDSCTAEAALGIVLEKGDHAFKFGSGTEIVFSGVIKGEGRPCFTGSNDSGNDQIAKQVNRTLAWKSVVRLTAHNAFSGGFKTQDTTIYLSYNDSLGQAGTQVEYNGHGPLVFAESGEICYDFTGLDRSPWLEFDLLPVDIRGTVSNDVTTTTLTLIHSVLGLTDRRLNFHEAFFLPKATVQGACGFTAVNFLAPVTVKELKGNGGCYNGANTYNFHTASNAVTTLHNNRRGNFKCHVKDAFPGAQFNFSPYADGTTLDMNGFDQTAKTLLFMSGTPKNDAAYSCANRVFTSASPATLTLEADADAKAIFSLRDAASLVWAPVSDCRMVITNSVFTSTGTVCVARGTVVLDAGFGCDAGMSFDLATDSSLEILCGQTVTVKTLSVGGVPQWAGAYTFGDGTLQVTDFGLKPCLWTGSGTTASAEDAGNWGGVVPDTTGMPLVPTFAQAGSEAEFVSDAVYAGIVFNGAVDAFRLRGDGAVALNECGIRVDGGCQAVVETELALTRKAQTLRIASGAAFRTDAAVSSEMPLTVTGGGVWEIGPSCSIAGIHSLTADVATVSFVSGDAAVAQTMPPLVLAGAVSVVVGDWVTLTLGEISAAGAGSLDIAAPSFDRIVSSDLKDCVSPEWLTVNGVRVRFDADGKASEYEYDGGEDIAASGGVISDAELVRIAENGGSADGVTLSSSEVTVGTLVHKASDDAVVSLEGGVLTASSLVRLAGAGSFVIGSSSGDGTLTASGGAMLLDNRDGEKDIVIRSAIAPDSVSLEKTGAGVAVLPSSGVWSVSATIENGALAVSEDASRIEFSKDESVSEVDISSDGQKLAVDNLSGSLEIAGGAYQEISSFAVSGGRVTVADGARLHIADITESVPVAGELVVTNASFTIFDPEKPIVSDASEEKLWRAFNPGRGGDGVLRVCAGAVVTGKLHLASSGHAGAAYFEGGDTAIVAGDANRDPAGYTILAVGDNAQGYAEVREGATVTQYHSSRFVDGTANATLAVLGGTYVATNWPGIDARYGYWAFANGSGMATLFVRGGVFRSHAHGQMLDQGAKASSHGVITVADGGVMSFANNLLVGYGKSAENTRGTVINVINGGQLRIRDISSSTDFFPAYVTNAVGERAIRPVYFNFDGGVVSHSLATLFGTSYDGYNCLSRVTVFEKGATFSGDASTLFPFPFSAPEGAGVKSVPWTARSGFVAPPSVRIDGDGYGASAYAEFDSRSGSVTNILVTSPGCNYTHATAVLLMGSTTLAEIPCEISPNAATGALTFRGAARKHVLEKTWGEWTVGEIRLDNPDAAQTVCQRGDDLLSTNTVLSLMKDDNVYTAVDETDDGAVAYRLRCNSVRGTAGRVTGSSDGFIHAQRLDLAGAGDIDFDGLVYRVEGTWEIDVADLVEREKSGASAGCYACDIVFADEARIVFRNLDRLEELEKRARLVKTSGNGCAISFADGLFAGVDLPRGWRVYAGSAGISLAREKGMTLVFR